MKRQFKQIPLLLLSTLAAVAMVTVTINLPRIWRNPDCPCGWETIFGCDPICPDTPPPSPTPKPVPTPRPQVQPKECGHWDLWTC